MRPSVLVTDGQERAALAAVRSLGRADYRVCVCSPFRRSLAGVSKYAHDERRVTDPKVSPDDFVESVRELVGCWNIDFVLPITDISLLPLLSRRDRLPGARIPFPEIAAYRRLSDKALVTEAGRELGLRVPRQRTLRTREETSAPKEVPRAFPLYLKPSRSVVMSEGRLTTLPVVRVGSESELEARLDELPPEAYPLLLQEPIEGVGTGLFLLRHEGRTVAAFAHRRLREKPPGGGVSVYRESIPVDPELLDSSERLLDRFGWSGVAMVEFKRDSESGEAYLMEVNARFWGSLQLAIDAGVDFPALLLAVARGERPEPVDDYAIGMRSRWWWGEVDHLLARVRSPEYESMLPPETPSRPRTLLNILSPSSTRDRTEIRRLSDLMPFLLETRAWIMNVLT